MNRLYEFLINPKATIQRYNHQKDWGQWWLIMAVGAGLSMLKWSAIGVFPWVIMMLGQVGVIVVYAIMVDASGQLLGLKGQLRTIIYWLGFNQAIFWVLPSLEIIQRVSVPVGSLFIFALNIVAIYFFWVTIRQIYNVSTLKQLVLIGLPFGVTMAGVVLVILWLVQEWMMLS